MREPGFGNGILLNGVGCWRCKSLEPVGEDTVEVSYNDLHETAHRGCQGCWVLSEAVSKCCGPLIAEDASNLVVRVQRPMLRDFVEVVVLNSITGVSATLDIFSDPGGRQLSQPTLWDQC
jgi:hypothetical protein